MAGTKAGGQAAAATNKELYGSDFYKKIGSKGGTQTHTSGKLARVNFAHDDRTLLDKLRGKPTRAQLAGKKGGTISRRGPKVLATQAAPLPVKVMSLSGHYKAVVSVIPPHNTFYVYISSKEK